MCRYANMQMKKRAVGEVPLLRAFIYKFTLTLGMAEKKPGCKAVEADTSCLKYPVLQIKSGETQVDLPSPVMTLNFLFGINKSYTLPVNILKKAIEYYLAEKASLNAE